MKRIKPISLVEFSMMAIVTVVSWIGGLQAVTAQNHFTLDESQFDAWLYGNSNRVDDVDSQITLAIEGVDHVCHLTGAQSDKLRLAGQGDYSRFDRQADELRSELVGTTYNQNEIGDVYQKVRPLATTYQAGLLGRSSLFAKVIRSTLTPEQTGEYAAAEKERLKANHAAQVKLFVAMLERGCPLTSAQRTRLVELLRSETKPALRSGQYDQYVIPAQCSAIKEEKFTAILDEAQFRVLNKTLQQGRGLRRQLVQQGILADD
jgi:hypothetical protein